VAKQRRPQRAGLLLALSGQVVGAEHHAIAGAVLPACDVGATRCSALRMHVHVPQGGSAMLCRRAPVSHAAGRPPPVML
jgi:hypothetical protein